MISLNEPLFSPDKMFLPASFTQQTGMADLLKLFPLTIAHGCFRMSASQWCAEGAAFALISSSKSESSPSLPQEYKRALLAENGALSHLWTIKSTPSGHAHPMGTIGGEK